MCKKRQKKEEKKSENKKIILAFLGQTNNRKQKCNGSSNGNKKINIILGEKKKVETHTHTHTLYRR